MPDKEALAILALFTDFLKQFGEATPEQKREVIEFIGPQSRSDLIELADALRKRDVPDQPRPKK
jgi:hypothetical protein